MRPGIRSSLLTLSLGVGILPATLLAGETPAGRTMDPRFDFFEWKVRPILSEECYNCHSADTKAAGGLRLDALNGLLVSGDEGPAAVRGEVENSLLLQRVNMPMIRREGAARAIHSPPHRSMGSINPPPATTE